MASISLCLSLILAVATARTATASGGFLVRLEAVEKTLEEELSARAGKSDGINELMQLLHPSYTALPKNAAGNLEHHTARYLLHRLFVQWHGWYIKGLEPNGDVFHTAAEPESFKKWVPSYLVDNLERRSEYQGLDLKDVAVLGAALQDLIHQEAIEFMMRIYMELRIAEQSPQTVRQAVKVYMTSFLSSQIWDAEAAVRKQDFFTAQYTDWNQTYAWYSKIEEEHLKGSGGDAGVASSIAISIGRRYGSFNDRQCSALKAAFIGMWAKAKTTGRIRLADFYRVGLDSQWFLVERKEYLRALGALDETNASSPLVIIPNYMTARPNCMDATSLYEVCCRNECEDLLGHLERTIAAPSASPDRILELVSTLGSDTVQAGRTVDTHLVVRLQQIADRHGGEVKLHGRLFAQWMHHAYPNECPYPHEAGAADPSSPDAWIGMEVSASEAERRAIVEAETCGPEEAAAEWTVELPWSHTEELLPQHSSRLASARSPVGWRLISPRLGLAAAGGAGILAALTSHNISWPHALISALCLLAVASNMVNPVLLGVMLLLGLLLPRAFAARAPGGKRTKEGLEKGIA